MKLSDQAKKQLSLRISQGGFGLTQSRMTGLLRFLGAWASSLRYLPDREKLAVFCDSLLLNHIDNRSTASSFSIASHLDKALQKMCTATVRQQNN